MFGMKKDFKTLLKPYYIINIIVSFSYIFAKKISPICDVLFPGANCELDMHESQILFFLLIVVMIRTRRSGSVTMISYLSSSFIYTKVANLVLWFYADFRMGLIFGVVFVLLGLLVPEPTYSGPENIVYFRASGLDEEIERDKRIIWVVTFYTVWSPSCVNFAPVFAQLSHEYALDNLKFGKIDIGRYPDVAKKYAINDSSFSKQLPTVILFKDGKEIARRPAIDSRRKIQKFFFSEDNMKVAFDLNNLYQECKKNPLKSSKKRKGNLELESDSSSQAVENGTTSDHLKAE